MDLHYFSFLLNLVCFSNGFLLSLQGENVALNMTATQISTFDDWSADRAVDGCTNQSAESDCCSKTLPANDNEWVVDFGTQRNLGKFHIYGLEGGEDELAGFEIWFGIIKQLIYTNVGKPYTDMMEIYPEPPVQTSRITIRRRNDTVEKNLTICEFEAFEACTEGFYGEACSSTCGNCLNNDTCYGNTGKCAKGCDAGWKGDVCKTVCTDGEYGANCESACGSCFNNETCDVVTGSCPSGCDPGYTGDKCDTASSTTTSGVSLTISMSLAASESTIRNTGMTSTSTSTKNTPPGNGSEGKTCYLCGFRQFVLLTIASVALTILYG